MLNVFVAGPKLGGGVGVGAESPWRLLGGHAALLPRFTTVPRAFPGSPDTKIIYSLNMKFNANYAIRNQVF